MLNYQQDVPAFHIYFSILVKFAVEDMRLREFGEYRHSEGRTFLIGVNMKSHTRSLKQYGIW
jgi:hypothetical protein